MRYSDGWKLPHGEVSPSYTAQQLVSSPAARQQKHQHEGRRLKRRLELCTVRKKPRAPLPPPVDAGLQEC